MAQVKKFDNGITASVLLLGKGKGQLLEASESGILTIPGGIAPNAFSLILQAEEGARIVFAQKNIGQDKGGYNNPLVIGQQVLSPPIQVMRQGQNVWTSWHQEKPNRVDCWIVGKDGRLELFQVGVITNDDGQTFRLLGEPRWQGQIFEASAGELVAKPDEPWGPLLWREGESRAAICEHPDFQALLASATLPKWTGSPKEIDPPLDLIPEGNFARVDWYIPFAGQKGQGIAKDSTGKSYWIHGQDFAASDADGINRLHHNDLISYVMVHQNWGTKKDGPPKLLGVRRVERVAQLA